MASKKPTPKGAKALLRRYGHDLDRIRAEYEAKASDLQRQARRLESDYKVLTRQFRKEVATLKRKGVIPREVDARKATPTSFLSRALNDLGDLLTGRTKAVKVAPEVAKRLKAQDVQIVRGRAILSPRFTIRKGEVVEKAPKAPGMSPSGVIRRINLRSDYEDKVREVFARMGADDYVGVDLGFNFSRLFNADELEDFLNYLDGRGSFDTTSVRYISLIRVKTSELQPYFRQMALNALQRQRDKEAARKARAAEAARRRRARKGPRGSKNYG